MTLLLILTSYLFAFISVQTVGLDFRSDVLWERYIDWELERKNLRNVTSIYRRLVAIPTKLFNRHWDNFIAHVRDHHPRDILEYEEYDELRRVTCDELSLTYRPGEIDLKCRKGLSSLTQTLDLSQTEDLKEFGCI